MIMGRGEPTLVPEWLKGTGETGASEVTSCSQAVLSEGDNTIFATQKASQQASSSGRNQRDYDYKQSSLTTDTVTLPATRRRTLTSSGSGKEHLLSDTSRVYSISGRLSPYLTTTDGSKDFSPRVQSHHYDWNGEADQDFLRDKVVRIGIGDEKERERDRLGNELSFGAESNVARWPTTAVGSRHEVEYLPKNSQASKFHENGYKKPYEMGNSILATSSVSVSLAASMHKAAFERNFPSLGSDEKQSGVAGHRPSWHGLSRSDVSRDLSPRLNKSNALPEGWSFTALVDTSVINSNTPSSGMVASVPSSNMSSQTCNAVTPVTPTNVMNMAEALVQNSPRVRASQPVLESQKLEELALKQSRQLIPVTPPLPKAIGADKGKQKLPGFSKVNQLSKPSINATHRTLTSIKPDMPKLTQGKLLVLKASKDGGTSLLSNAKADGFIPAQTASLVNGGANSNTPVVQGTRRQKQFGDNKVLAASVSAAAEGGIRLRSWDSVMAVEDKRPVQTQNRSEFFNTLRKKAYSNGISSCGCEKPDSICAQKDGQVKVDECDPRQGVNHVKVQNNHSGENTSHDSILGSQRIASELHANGDDTIVPGPADVLSSQEAGAQCMDSTLSDDSAGFRDASFMGGSEEEEAAFLRSLGWEEDAEGGDALTEEEINAFYQMRAKFIPLNAIKLASSKSHVQQRVGGVGAGSSAFSSSDSESDGEALARCTLLQ